MALRQSSKGNDSAKVATAELSNQEIAIKLVTEFIASRNTSYISANPSEKETRDTLNAKADLDAQYITSLYYKTLNLLYDTQHWYKNIR